MPRSVPSAGMWLLLAACSGSQHALVPGGPHAARIATLTWVMLAIMTLVFVTVGALLGYALLRRRSAPTAEPLPARSDDDVADRDPRALTLSGARGLVIWGGAGIPALILLFLLGYSVGIGRQVVAPAPPGSPEIELIGHQFWWEVRYLADDAAHEFRTANEIYIPVGQPVRVKVRSADVIHSFWVPNLHGKIDLVPRRANELVLHADRPGIYRGQCAEFCGVQHALMALYVVAVTEEEYHAWRARQLQPAEPPTDSLRIAGEAVFLRYGCGACHAIRGTRALASVAPDLTHFGSRLSIGAATLPNRTGQLAAWIADPQGIKPGNFMPALPLPGEELNALVAYLQGLH
jgi:cytochrome c oxidase subunit II